MNTSPPAIPARSFRYYAWHAVRLAAATYFLTAAGCPLKDREQEGDPPLNTGVYTVTITPATGAIEPATLLDNVADIPFTVTGQCLGACNDAEMAFYQPMWEADLRGTDGPGIQVTINDPTSHTSAGSIRITDLPAFFAGARVPNDSFGNVGYVTLSVRPTTPLAEGTGRGRGLLAISLLFPGNGVRDEAAADNSTLTAGPRDLLLVPPSGESVKTLTVLLKYTGSPTRLADAVITGPGAARFTPGFAPGEQLGGDHTNNSSGVVTFTALPNDFSVHKAKLIVTTQNGAVATVFLRGRR